MTRPIARAAALAALLLTAPACKHKAAGTIEEAPRMVSTIRMSDVKSAKQLLGGFYDLEAGAWRWTAKQFSVNLRPSAHASSKGATLEVHLTIPASSLQKLGPIALSATIGGFTTPPETYSKSGDYVYRRYLTPNLFPGDTVRVDFQLDKAIPPGDVDMRELGIVVSSVGLGAR